MLEKGAGNRTIIINKLEFYQKFVLQYLRFFAFENSSLILWPLYFNCFLPHSSKRTPYCCDVLIFVLWTSSFSKSFFPNPSYNVDKNVST